MKISTTEQFMTVHGRISSVHWLEDSPWNARKMRGQKYFYYALTVPTNQVQELARRLEGEEYEETGVWIKTEPIFLHEPPHPAYVGFTDYLSKHPKAARHLAMGQLCFGPQQVDDDDCQEFCLVQLDRIIRDLRALGEFTSAQEAQRIRVEIVERRGEAYAQHKPRLQELAAVASDAKHR